MDDERKFAYVVTCFFCGHETPEAVFLDENLADVHAQEMEKVEEGSWGVSKVQVKDWPRDI